MTAYDYPVFGAFLTVLWFFLWFLWLMLLFRTIADIFRSHDMSGWGKAGWLILVIILPYLGVFIYLIARGGKMAERDMKDMQRSEEAFQAYVRETAASGGSSADELAKLADLRDRGVITDEEFATQKAKVLS